MALQFVTQQIKDSAITTAKVADDAITSAKIVDANIITALLADDAVSQAKIADDAVGADQLAANAVVFTSIASAAYETDLSVSASASKLVTASASKAYADSVASGLDVKESCKVATTANITLSGTQTIDGVSVAADQRVLVKDQSTGTENGIYLCKAGAWARASDFATGSSEAGAFTFIEEGTVNADNGFVCTNNAGADVVGTNAMVFSQFSGAGSIIAGDGLAKSGNTLSVNVDDSSIEIAGDALQVKASGITNAMLAGSIADSKLLTISTSNKVSGSAVQLAGSGGLEDDSGLKISAGGVTNAMLAGSIQNAKLVNSTISGVALGGNLNALTPATNGGILFSSYNGSAAVGNVQLDISDLAAAAVDVANDSIAIYDNDADATGKESIADLMTAVAGSGLSATSGVLAVSGITSAMITDGAIVNADINASAGIALSKLEALTDGKIIVGSAGNVASPVAMSGDATLANTGALTIANAAITSAKIATAVAGNGITGGGGSALSVDLDGTTLSVSASGLKIKDGGVGTAQIGDNQVTAAKIADLGRGSILYGDSSGATAALVKGAANTVLASNGTDIAYALIDNAMIDASAAIALTKLEAVSSGNIIVGNGSNAAASVAMSGDVAIANNGATTIQANAISTAKIADDAVTFAKMGITPVVQRVASTSSTASLTLSSRITDATYRHPANVRVFLNGQRLIGLSGGSPSGYEQYTVGDDGSDTSITFGSALPDGSDLYVEYYA